MAMKHLPLYIVTGLSGSGKSVAAAALEDAGFFCVENLPVDLLPKFLELPLSRDSEIAGFAFVMDAREKGFAARQDSVLARLRQQGVCCEIIFLEAEEAVLVKRFSETRRRHPLARDRELVAGIRLEAEQMRPIREAADHVVDTSRLTAHELKARILDIARSRRAIAPMHVQILSFGFKYGLPLEADLVLDVRFLANPHFVPELQPLDGEHERIQDFVLGSPEGAEFLEKTRDLLDFLVPRYAREGKSRLTLAVGCTGGRHRSVAVARRLYEHLAARHPVVRLAHRDLERAEDPAGEGRRPPRNGWQP